MKMRRKEKGMKCSEIHIRDPFVLVHEGKYYMYGTFGPECWSENPSHFDVYVSEDLENWSEPVCCFDPPEGFWGTKNFWAPEVHEWKGKFYLFASFKSKTHCRGTAILRADSPMGPFLPHSEGAITPADWECLDGTFYVSKEGKPYMVFCHEWVQVGDGEMWAMPLTEDLKAAAGDMKLLFRASEPAWVKSITKNSTGLVGYVTDGPFMWRTPDGTLLCLWASFSDGGYTEAIAVSDNGEIDGKFIHIEPLFKRDGGHGMVFRAMDGQMYLTLHSPNRTPDERPVFRKLTEKPDGFELA